jgi:hypothetical protein
MLSATQNKFVSFTQSIKERHSIKYSKGKGKFHHITGHEDPEVEKRYRYNLSLTSALDRVGG